jgi:glycosyltransferase involved in cell wall biosynthesis
MRLLFLSNLFPDQAEPYRGLDNSIVLRQLARRFDIRTLSPRPAIPGSQLWFRTRYCKPEDAVLKPAYLAYPYIPKFGSRFNHRLLYHQIRRMLLDWHKVAPFDVLLSSWAYPDACALARIAEDIKVPFVAVTQGTDVHTYLDNPVRRKIIFEALSRASAVINRSRDLANRLQRAGINQERLHVVYNGVDLETFRPEEPLAARRELGLPEFGKIVLFVGNLLPVKNPDLLLNAWAIARRTLPDESRLVMVGKGPLEREVRHTISRLGLQSQVILAGPKNSQQVARYLQAADLLVLSSRNEGVPNVVLEAFASGRRVVTTNIGGIKEVLTSQMLGVLVDEHEPAALANAIGNTLDVPADVAGIRKHALYFNWERAAAEYAGLLSRATSGSPA